MILRLDGQFEFWETLELTTSESGQSDVIDGPWHAAPGDLEVIARYRPLDGAANESNTQVYPFTLGNRAEDYTAVEILVTDQWEISVSATAPPPTADVPASCPPVSEW